MAVATPPWPLPPALRRRRWRQGHVSPGARQPMVASAAAAQPLGGSAVGGAGALAATPSLASLLSGNVIQGGEVILLLLKPSAWFIILHSLRFIAAVALAMVAAAAWNGNLGVRYAESGVLLIVGRLMWAVLQWMSRLYILTDMRVIRLAGVFNVDIFECPLRKVARTRVVRPLRERLLGLGTIEIAPQDAQDGAAGLWQTIRRPVEVHEQVVAAINRAKQSGRGCPPR